MSHVIHNLTNNNLRGLKNEIDDKDWVTYVVPHLSWFQKKNLK